MIRLNILLLCLSSLSFIDLPKSIFIKANRIVCLLIRITNHLLFEIDLDLMKVLFDLLIIIFLQILKKIESKNEMIRCYICDENRNKEECRGNLSSNRNVQIRQGGQFFYSCSIELNRINGFIRRDFVESSICQSSSWKYCCKDDLCNDLDFIPRPSLKSLICYSDRCQIDRNRNGNRFEKCFSSNPITYRSNVLQSCFLKFDDRKDSLTKSFSEICSPGHRISSSSIDQSSLSSEQISCCYSSKCNYQYSNLNDEDQNEDENVSSQYSLQCYLCDSRIFGLNGCEEFNPLNRHVYQRKTSNRDESCVTIVGFEGFDHQENVSYSSFVLRTFLSNCQNQSIGLVSFAGIQFQGFIICCSTNLCNRFDVQIRSLSSSETSSITTTTTTTTTNEAKEEREKDDETTKRMIDKTSTLIEEISIENLLSINETKWNWKRISGILVFISILILILILIVVISIFIVKRTKKRRNEENLSNEIDLDEMIGTMEYLETSSTPFFIIK